MSAPEIITYLVERGHTVDFDRETQDIWIRPQPEPVVAKRVMAREADLVAYLNALPSEPASSHRYVVMADAVGGDMHACIECGIPLAMHGRPPLSSWTVVQDSLAVPTRNASPIVPMGVMAA